MSRCRKAVVDQKNKPQEPQEAKEPQGGKLARGMASVAALAMSGLAVQAHPFGKCPMREFGRGRAKR